MPSQAAPQRFGPRAGSNFSGAPDGYGRTAARPYRRQQRPGRQSSERAASKFDYRFDADEEASLDNFDESANYEVTPAAIETVGFCDGSDNCCCGTCTEPSCGCEEASCGCDDLWEPGCGCEDSCCSTLASCCSGEGKVWSAGFEWTFLKPRFTQNVAFTTLTSDGNNNDTFTDSEFSYDLELSPRVWVAAAMSDCWSWRVSYWQFDHDPGTLTTQPNANGFGEITHPQFGDVDISTTIPNERFTASSSLNAYTIDAEALKQAHLSGWQIGVGGGVRYASADQSYSATLRDAGNAVVGQINFSHQLDGFGPTISLSGKRNVFRKVNLVCAARGSLLYGDGQSRLFAQEDTTPSTTLRTTNRDDLLPIGEARVGLEWLSPKKRGGWQWLMTTAMEGQIWGNAGNASSETADLGFFGFNVGAGLLH